MGDPVLPESKKEQVKKTLEPTQQELVVKASQEARFPKRIQDDKKHPWNDPHWSRPDRFSSQRIKVSCALTLKYRHHCMILHGYE